jgi:iron complex transport system substrate-binding protein
MLRRQRNSATVVLASAVLALAAPVTVAQSPAVETQAPRPVPFPVVITDADGNAVAVPDASRVVTLGGVITEVAYALGAQDQVVAVDASSFYPPDAQQAKQVVGYYRMLAAEPVLAADPSLVLGTADVGPPEVVQQIRDAAVTTLLLPVDNSVDGAKARITAVGAALGRDAEAARVVAALDQDLKDAQSLVATATSTPRVLFFLLPPGAPMLLSGTGTEADTMIGLAGAQNAVTDFPGYVPLTPEAVAAAAPDIILTTTSSLQAAGGIDELLADPGLAATPAGKAGAVVALDDLYLLGFGPRLGQAVAELAGDLHPEIAR